MKKKVAVIGGSVVIVILLVICSVVICSVVMSKPWRYVSIKRSVGVSEEEFRQKMEKLDEYYHTTNFSSNAEQLLSLAQEKGYNEYFAPAIICVATNGGTETKGTFNYWTWDTMADKRAEYALGFRVSIAYETPKASIKSFFNKLECYGNVTYEEFSRNPNATNGWVPSYQTAESDAYGKELYEKVQWIQSL